MNKVKKFVQIFRAWRATKKRERNFESHGRIEKNYCVVCHTHLSNFSDRSCAVARHILIDHKTIGSGDDV